MYPGNEFNIELIMSLINKAYWPIYGEMAILEEINMDREECLKKGDTCPTQSGTYYSYAALIAYMVIANVLLINLLIAMFSSTFQHVQDNTDRIWKFQRYRLVFEYYDASAFPPPISFIGYVLSIFKYLKSKSSRETETEDDEFNNDEDELFLERKFAEEYVRNKKIQEREAVDSRLRYNNDKLDYLEQKLNEIVESRYKDNNQVILFFL